MDYKEKLEEAKRLYESANADQRYVLESLFPELTMSKDEKIRKEIITYLSIIEDRDLVPLDDWLAWLEKQESVDEIVGRCKNSWYNEGKIQGQIEGLTNDEKYQQGWHDALEKQGEQKSLYVRFGDIPNNEQSKIYNGENEIGIENGVSVYPAFIDGDNVILGLTLPITKTTLYTQQHLLEYDARPCYLVTGDYVGKGADGEPLIKNISIIKEIKDYRIKEIEKQGEQKPNPCDECINVKGCINCENGELRETEQKSADKVVPKFKNGQWIVWQDKCYKVNNNGCGYELVDQNGLSTSLEYGTIDENAHFWDISKDAKNGDVLVDVYGNIGIFKERYGINWHTYCYLGNEGRFISEGGSHGSICYPATKEQRDLLFSKMKEAGYEWDAEKKELKKIEPKTADEVGNYDHKEVLRTIINEQKSAWSEEDEEELEIAIDTLKESGQYDSAKWVQSLKQRIGG